MFTKPFFQQNKHSFKTHRYKTATWYMIKIATRYIMRKIATLYIMRKAVTRYIMRKVATWYPVRKGEHGA